MLHKNTQVESINSDLVEYCIYGFTETWLKKCDHERFWQLKKDFKTFRADRKLTKKIRGGGAMIIVPKNLKLQS